jgi:2-polyprenyl-6-methoxyphenol hydroxylase-like FAD-dependent oxidoreductase
VVILERTERIAPVGAGLALFANAMAALERLGVSAHVAAAGSAGRRAVVLTWRGRCLNAMPLDLLDGMVAVPRADLHSVLAARAGDVRLGSEVVSVRQHGEAVVVGLADGGQEHADLVVGADGLRSVVRRAIADVQLRFAGYTAWRGVAPVSVGPGRMSESWGRGERFGLVDIGRSRTYWFATKTAHEGEPDEPHGRKAEVLRRFTGWHHPIGAVAEATAEGDVLRNDVYDLEPLPRWSQGRVTLLGDAAPAATPGVGQGAAQAIEDAVALTGQLARQSDLHGALAAYEVIRRPRATAVQVISRRVDAIAQLDSPLGCRIRNAAVRAVPDRLQRPRFESLVRLPDLN